MSRRSKKTAGRKLTEAELLNSFEQSLDTLERLAQVYDDGYPPIAFTMATEVYKILTENSAATRLRASRRFSTPLDDHGPTVLSSLHKLTIAQIGGQPPTLTFLPQFHGGQGLPSETVEFKKWWNKDVIYMASASLPGTPAGMIALDPALRLPFDQREKTTRLGLVNLLRNKLGAHQASEMPELLDALEAATSWGSLACDTPDGQLNTDDGSLPVVVSPLAAMMRQIAHELLVAYDRSDEPPPQPEEGS